MWKFENKIWLSWLMLASVVLYLGKVVLDLPPDYQTVSNCNVYDPVTLVNNKRETLSCLFHG